MPYPCSLLPFFAFCEVRRGAVGERFQRFLAIRFSLHMFGYIVVDLGKVKKPVNGIFIRLTSYILNNSMYETVSMIDR